MKQYDNACKILAERFKDDLSQWLLGQTYPFSNLEPTDLPTDPIMADTVIFLESEKIILHLEFQTGNDYDIPLRMLDYYVRLHKKYPKKDIRQFVIYLRKTQGKLSEKTTFQSPTTSHQFQVIRLWEESPEIFLKTKGLLPFATLSKSNNPEELLRKVAKKLETLESKTEREDLASLSALFAGLVLKKEQVNQIIRSEMMKESSVYQDIFQQGEQKGILLGREEGREEGLLEGKREIVMRLLSHGMSLDEISQITDLSLDNLQTIIQSVANNN